MSNNIESEQSQPSTHKDWPTLPLVEALQAMPGSLYRLYYEIEVVP